MMDAEKDIGIRQREVPEGKNIAQGENPEQYYLQNPA